MTHAQYKTRLCTCEHALSRTPTRAIHQAYARSQPASQPGISLSPPLATFLLLFLLLLFRVDARGIHSAVKARGYRIGDRPFFGDPNRPIDLSPSLSSLPPRKFDENHPLLPRGIVPLRAPLSSCACFDDPSFRDDSFLWPFLASCKEETKERRCFHSVSMGECF